MIIIFQIVVYRYLYLINYIKKDLINLVLIVYLNFIVWEFHYMVLHNYYLFNIYFIFTVKFLYPKVILNLNFQLIIIAAIKLYLFYIQ